MCLKWSAAPGGDLELHPRVVAAGEGIKHFQPRTKFEQQQSAFIRSCGALLSSLEFIFTFSNCVEEVFILNLGR